MRVGKSLIAAAGFAAVVSLASVSAVAAPTWSQLYTQTSTTTRSLRSLELSSNDSQVFAGFIQGSSTSAVYDLDPVLVNTVDQTYGMSGVQPNGLATDDRGNLYIGTGSSGNIRIRATSNLATQVNPGFNGGTTATAEGVDILKSGSNYYLYVSRGNGTVQKFDVTNPAAPIVDTTFGTGGTFTVPGAGQLRGLTVAPTGEIYVAQRDTTGSDRLGTVYKLTAGNSPTVTSTSVSGAMDIALFGGSLYVTKYTAGTSAIAQLDASTLALQDTLTTGFSRGSLEGYAGIDVTSDGRLYMVDQIYAGTGTNASDRVLVSTAVPEPVGLAVIGLASLALVRRRRAATAC